MKNNILNPYVKGLADGADHSLHAEAVCTGTPSVEPDTGMFLEFFAASAQPGQILELGCGIGVSTRYIARGAPDAHITAVDYNRERLSHAEKACAGLNTDFVFSEAAKFLTGDKKNYDLIFVDSVKKDYPVIFCLAFERLNKGGTIIFDDIFLYGEVFKQDCEISAKYLPAVKILRQFTDMIKKTYRHVLLPVGGGMLLVSK